MKDWTIEYDDAMTTEEQDAARLTKTQKHVIASIEHGIDKKIESGPYTFENLRIKHLGFGLIVVTGENTYRREDGSKGNGMNDSQFHAVVTKRGKVEGSVYSVTGRHDFSRKNADIVIGIY